MNESDANETIGINRIESRYIIMNEDIFDALTKEECRVYMALRYESDYSKETSIVKRSINFLVKKSKVSRRTVFYCLASLETQHFLIQRIILPVTGVQNNYNVARTINFFNPLKTSAPDALVPETSASHAPTSASDALGSASHAPGSAPDALHIINLSVINSVITTTTTDEDQILTNHPHSEPVVVSSTSLTSTPKVNPQTKVKRVVAKTDIELVAAFRAKPTYSENILTEDDFLSACDHMIADRGDQPLRGRIKGIIGFVSSGSFQEPEEWAKARRAAKNRAKGDANLELQLKASAQHAKLDPEIKGRDDALAKLKSMGIGFKDQTIVKNVYGYSTIEKNTIVAKKTYKKINLSEQVDEAIWEVSL